jgi:hypothetical protein
MRELTTRRHGHATVPIVPSTIEASRDADHRGNDERRRRQNISEQASQQYPHVYPSGSYMRHPANVPLPIHPFVGKGFIPAERRPFLCLSLYTDRSGVYPAPQSAVWCAKVKRPDREPSRAVLILETHSQPYPSQQLTLHIRPIHSPRHSAHMITPPWDVSVNAPPPLAQLLLLPREARQRSALVHQLGCAHSVYQAIKYTISVGSVTTLHHFRPISNTLGTPPESRHSKEISVSKQSRRWRQQQQTTTTKLGPYFDLYCYVFIHAANML